MKVDVPEHLRDLEKVADRIAAMFEWEALAQQERGSRALPPFVMSYKNRQELDDLYSQFGFLCMNLNMILDDPALSARAAEREAWRRRLHAIQEWVQGLNRSDGFING